MTELLTAAQMQAVEAAAIASGQVTGLELMERAGRGVVEAIFEEWPELAPPPGALPSQLSVDWGPAPRQWSSDQWRTTGSPPGYLETDEGAEKPYAPHRAVVLCGPGNNGGDGFVVARLLKGWGWEVEVFLYGDPGKLPPDARVNYERWVGMGEVGSLIKPAKIDALKLGAGERGVLVDAVFGTGLTRPLEEELRIAIVGFLSRVPISFLHSVAVDVPSGICSDSGKALVGDRGFGAEWHYDLIVTFHRLRVGHCLFQRSARVVVRDIGLDSQAGPLPAFGAALSALGSAIKDGVDLRSLIDVDAEVVAATRFWNAQAAKIELVAGYDALLDKAANGAAHKYAHGHAFVLSGPSGRGGAARLAARGALRIGAGVVTVGCPLDAIPEHAARLDAVMLRGVADGAALEGVLQDGRINALCLGPGMGTGTREAGLVGVALGVSPGNPPSPPHEGEGRASGLPSRAGDAGQALPLPRVGSGEGRGGPSHGGRRVVLDADALTILSQDPDLFAALHDGCVLTPHAGEFARLFPDIAAKLAAPATRGPAYSKVDATREAAARAGCVVLYKGPDTVIAAADGRCAINSAHYHRAAPWLATAGSGDVLAGFIAGLLARGFSPFDAACTGAWLHVECALSFGPGLIAEDLPEELPKVFRELGL
jgi:hydroxyethylthiazole kinase-like uncharacterized protein yjeF